VIFGTRDYPKSESLCGRVCGLCGGNYWLCNRDQRGLLVLIETRADAAHRETVTDETIAVGAPAGTFFDFSAIHLVTTATFATLVNILAGELGDPVTHLCPNGSLRHS